MIINNHWCIFAVLEESNQVDASRVDSLVDKHCTNTVWKLGQRAKCSQEVAIAQRPLIYIIWIDSIFKNARLLINLASTLPIQIFKQLSVLRIYSWVEHTALYRQELAISPRFALCDRLFDHSVQLLDIL